MGGINWNPERAVITLCTLFTVDTSCVVLERNKRSLEGKILEKQPEFLLCAIHPKK